VAFLPLVISVESKILRVPADYPTIKNAVNAAHPRDTIIVSEGTYAEGEILVTKPGLSFVANGTVVVDGLYQGWVFYVTADNVTIEGFTVQNSNPGHPYAGICLDHAEDCTVVNNTVKCNTFGIFLFASSNNTVARNKATLNDLDGISLHYSDMNTIINNTATQNDFDGIYLGASDNNTLRENTVTDNKYTGVDITDSITNNLTGNIVIRNRSGITLGRYGGNILRDNNMTDNKYNFAVFGWNLSDFINDINPSNLVDGKRVYYLVNQDDITIDTSTFPDVGYVGVINSTTVTVRNVTVTNNWQGVVFAYTTNSTVENVNVTNNNYGVLLYESNSNTISRNIATKNCCGIFLRNSNGNLLSENALTNNGEGAELSNSNNNLLVNNTATKNVSGIFLDGANNNILSENEVADNRGGILWWGGFVVLNSHKNRFYENTLTSNDYGMYVLVSDGNAVYHNNFINNTNQVYNHASINMWNNDHPEGGNYWSNYHGSDLYSGIHQNITGGDGLGDTPFIIDENIQDCYPLMAPWRPLLGDVNGDGTVNIQDIVQAAIAYGSRQGDPNWNPFADLAPPWRIINILDLVTATANYGKET